MRRYILFIFSFWTIAGYSQENDIANMVTIDEVVISAAIEDFDVNDFISQVVEDTTFYQAFLNLKYFPHQIEGDMVVYEKDETEAATLFRIANQRLTPSEIKTIEIIVEESNGKIRRNNGNWRYLTAEVYDDVFFPTHDHKVSNTMVAKEQELVTGSKMEKHKAQLKKMLFNPGQPIDNVPFIGDKLAIFSQEMVPYYDYAIFLQDYADSIPCIVFSSYVKGGQEDEVVIQDMTSYFHRETGEVIAREYRLAHYTLFFDFDIKIKVQNKLQDGWLLPVTVSYDGWWDIPFKKPEIIKFDMKCTEYRTNVGRYAN
jgi:hypothetical protein